MSLIAGIDRALIIRKEWLDKIFDEHNPKIWEMRSSHTYVRGRIGLIEAKSGLVVGEAVLSNCLPPVTRYQAQQNMDKHQVENLSLLDKWRFPWVLQDVIRYDEPVSYEHPQGAVIWVSLNK